MPSVVNLLRRFGTLTLVNVARSSRTEDESSVVDTDCNTRLVVLFVSGVLPPVGEPIAEPVEGPLASMPVRPHGGFISIT